MSKIKFKTFYSTEIYLLIIFLSFCCQNYCVNAKECNSIFIRDQISALSTLNNCTVVKGNIIIAIIKKNNYTQANYDIYRFPKLREVTEFVLIYDLKGLETLANMFPNLAIIRGERLFENYALGIFEMPDIKELGLKSLMTIQKGHVFIDRCPHLCNAHMINWNRIAKSYGTNHIQKLYVDNCPNCGAYCSDKYCWGPHMCQLNETTNLADLSQNDSHCHTECLLGCYNTTDLDCVVCKNFVDNGKCVKSCPDDKYTHFEDKRCYDGPACNANKGLLFEDLNHFRECIKKCPYGYTLVKNINKVYECKKCRPNDKCPEITCDGGEIQYLQDAQYLKGCKTVDGYLEIKIDGKISEKILETYLGDIKVITQYLKIYNMPHINSLQFLNNLERINGEELKHNLFGLLIYDNHNLTKLWTSRKKVKILQGGLYIHSNDILCNHEVTNLQDNLEYDREKSHITFNEEEIYCSLPTIFVNYTVLSHNTVQIVWKNSDMYKNTEVFYREVKDKDLTIHNSSNDTIGFKFIWKREKLPNNNYFNNTKNYLTYNITHLKQNTKYELLIKTFSDLTENQLNEKQSKICNFKTNLDIPQSPTMKRNQKTSNSIKLEWDPKEYNEQIVTTYIIEVFMKIENQTYFDNRDYCLHNHNLYSIKPPMIKFDNTNDYCTYEKSLEQIENDQFNSAINEKYKCSDENLINCNINDNEKLKNQQLNNYVQTSEIQIENTIKIPGNQTEILISNLKYYTLYVFKLYACNQRGCSSYSLYHDRTKPIDGADTIDYVVVERSTKNDNEYHIVFYQPKFPNGVTVAYQIFLRRLLTDEDMIDFNFEHPNDEHPDHNLTNTTIECITRLQHENNKNKFILTLDKTGFEFTIRSVSLAGVGELTRWQKLQITPTNKLSVSHLGTTGTVFVVLFFLIVAYITFYVLHKYFPCSCYRPTLPTIRYRADDNDVLIEDPNSIEMQNDEIARFAY